MTHSLATKLAALMLACAAGVKKTDIPMMLEAQGYARIGRWTLYRWTGQQIAAARSARERSLDEFVATFVEKLGHNYGARQLQRAASDALGHKVSKRMLLRSMRRLNPWAHEQRRVFADSRRTRGTLDHVVTEGEWWQTDLDCKLQDYGLYVGGTIDVATRFLYNISVLTFKSSLAVWRQVQEPPLREFGLPAKYTMDKGSENWILAFVVMHADELDGRQGATKMRFVQSKRNVRSECFVADRIPFIPTCCMPTFKQPLTFCESRSSPVLWQSSASGASSTRAPYCR